MKIRTVVCVLVLVLSGSCLPSIPNVRSQVYTTVSTVIYSSVNRVWTMTGDNFHCTNDGFAFAAAAGDTITGTIVSNNPSMIAYILTEQALSAWEAGNSCDPRQDSPPVGVEWADGSRNNLLQQVSLDWTASVAGQYFVLVETFSYSSIVTVNVSTPSNGVVTQVLSVLATSPASSLQMPLQSQTGSDQTLRLVGLLWGAAIVFVIVMIYLLSRSRTRRKVIQAKLESSLSEKYTETVNPPAATTEEEQPSPPTPVVSQIAKTMYCSQCGSEISRDSKFCKECGSKQT